MPKSIANSFFSLEQTERKYPKKNVSWPALGRGEFKYYSKPIALKLVLLRTQTCLYVWIYYLQENSIKKKCSVYHPPKPQTFELLAKFQVPVEVRFSKGPKLGIIFGFEPFTIMLNLNNIQGSHTYTIENTQVLKIIGQRPLETEISNFELNFFRNFVTSPQPYNACLYARYFLLNFKLQSWTPNTTISYEKSLPKFFSESSFLIKSFSTMRGIVV